MMEKVHPLSLFKIFVQVSTSYPQWIIPYVWLESGGNEVSASVNQVWMDVEELLVRSLPGSGTTFGH